MQNFSLTQSGVYIAVIGSVLVHYGFTEACSNEITQLVPVIVGGIVSFIGRYRQGDITLSGFKK